MHTPSATSGTTAPLRPSDSLRTSQNRDTAAAKLTVKNKSKWRRCATSVSIWIDAAAPLPSPSPSLPSEPCINPSSLQDELRRTLYVYIMDDWPRVPPALRSNIGSMFLGLPPRKEKNSQSKAHTSSPGALGAPAVAVFITGGGRRRLKLIALLLLCSFYLKLQRHCQESPRLAGVQSYHTRG